MKKKIICMMLVLTLVLGMNVYAAESPTTSEAIDQAVPKNEIEQLEEGIATSRSYASAVRSSGGLYEYNDCIEAAYPYSETTKIAHSANEPNGHFNCNYAYTRLETEDDVDYFEITVRPGVRYAVVLKNVWSSQVRDIRLCYQTANGEWRYVTPPYKTERQTVFHFIPTVSKYYIEISGEPSPGYKHDSSTNWFAVAPDGTIDERPLVGSKKPYCSLK